MQVGTGVQIILTATATLLLATLGFLSPAARGALLTTAIVLFVFLALVAGFSATYVWGAMERSYAGWHTVCMHVAVYYPGIVMAIFTLLNIVIHHTGKQLCKSAKVVQVMLIQVLLLFICCCVHEDMHAAATSAAQTTRSCTRHE